MPSAWTRARWGWRCRACRIAHPRCAGCLCATPCSLVVTGKLLPGSEVGIRGAVCMLQRMHIQTRRHTCCNGDRAARPSTACVLYGGVALPGMTLLAHALICLEQAATGRRCGSAADLWSLGCIIAEMALRRPLFPCHSPAELLRQIADGLRTGSSPGLNSSKMRSVSAQGASARLQAGDAVREGEPPDTATARDCSASSSVWSWLERASPLHLELARVRRCKRQHVHTQSARRILRAYYVLKWK